VYSPTKIHLKIAVLASLLIGSSGIYGCGSTTAPTASTTPGTTLVQANTPKPADPNIQSVLGSTDISVGTNRLIFALLTENREIVRAPTANLSLYLLDGNTAVPKGTATAIFRRWPASSGGVFTAQVDFTMPGPWIIRITPVGVDVGGNPPTITLNVKTNSLTPALGAYVPRTQNITAADVSSLKEITTDQNPDADLYKMTIAESLQLKRPLIVTFATPAFCTSATCGPQIDVIKAIKKGFAEKATFIHIEMYENPLEMQENPGAGRMVEAVHEWGLPTEPWTFVVDAEGRLAAKFEGFASYQEIVEVLKLILP
jgi:hypothetical protein